MDPLSVSASIAALLGLAAATAQGLSKLKLIRAAETEVCALSSEISDIQAVLQQLRCSLDAESEAEMMSTSLPLLLKTATECLSELQVVIESRLVAPQGEPSRTKKVLRHRWVSEKPRIEGLRERLKELRHNIIAVVGIATRIDLGRVQLKLLNLHSLVDEVKQSQLELSETLQSYMRTLTTQAPDEGCSNGADSEPADRETSPDRRHPGSSLRIAHLRTSVYRAGRCRHGCPCACHARTMATTPRVFRHALGMLFIGYSGVPALRSACTEHACLGRASSSISLSYHFPSWMVAAVISASLRYVPPDGPQMALRTRRVVTYEARIFEYARRGDISGLQSLFATGAASPNDVSSVGGSTALHYAVRNQDLAACKFLLDQGADPYEENDAQKSAYDSAWNVVLCSSAGERHPLRDVFADDEPLEKRSFSRIHSIVLGLSPATDLNLSLEESTSAINSGDLHGRTPLSWAAERGDALAVMALLEHGAEVDKPCRRRKTPLIASLRAPNADCLRELLEHGADINHRGELGNTAMHLACLDLNDRRYMDPFLHRGADVNCLNDHGFTPLMIAAWRDHDEMVRALLQHGADIEVRCRKGRSALLLAVTTGARRVTRLLLAAGAAVTIKSERRETILHTAARADLVDADILRMLMKSDLGSVDGDAQDKDGLTAEDYLERRKDITEHQRGVFRELLAVTRCLSLSTISGCAPSDSDECRCFCSSSGCTDTIMAMKKLGRPLSWSQMAESAAYSTTLDEAGVGILGSRLAEVCRFELFRRLGMAHTCCNAASTQAEEGDPTTHSVERCDEEELRELQEEDRFSRDVLEEYMAVYGHLWTSHGDPPARFWHSWWTAVGEFLPEESDELESESIGQVAVNEELLQRRFRQHFEDVSVPMWMPEGPPTRNSRIAALESGILCETGN